MDLLREIWESLRLNKFRTAMTGFAVAWGIFILVVLLGISNGLENGIMVRYGSRLSNSVEIWGMWTSMPYKGLPAFREIEFEEKDAIAIRNMPEVELLSRVDNMSIKVVYGNQTTDIDVKGVEGDYQTILRKDILCGRFINANDCKHREKVAVLDERAVEELSATPEQILGNYITINELGFRIIGVCKKGDRWEGATIHIPFDTYQTVFNGNKQFSQMVMTMHSGTGDIKQRIKHTLAPLMQFDENDPQAIGVWSQEERVEEQNKVMNAIRLFILLLGLCTLMSGAVGVSNIMLVSVRERIKELGIRKALGAPPGTIMASVVGEALTITTLFGAIGLLFGIGIMQAVSTVLANSGGDDSMILNPTVDIRSVLIALLILIVIGTLAGATPARKAMRIKPIEAMRDK